MFNIPGFYPTPPNIINKMLSGIDFRTIKSILEPSAGSGNIVEEIISKLKYAYGSYYNKDKKFDIDTIELNENLQHILKGKGFRVVHDDFLSYNTFKRYDAIIMNPPFEGEEGCKHLLKAIEMQQQGGIIVCILNSETLKNPYTNTRKDLLNKLDQYNAEIEYIENAFSNAERKTNVEIAIIKINIPKTIKESVILNNLKKEEQHQKAKNPYNTNTLIHSDFIEGIIQQYNFEIKAGLNLISEYENLKPLTLRTFKTDKYSSGGSILKLSVYNDKNSDDTLTNGYIKQVRAKYWEALFTSETFTQLLTTNLQSEYMNKINELVDYDFSYYNIKQIQEDISKQMIQGVEETILSLFEELSYKHSYWDETSKNIHYYNGWKTNSAFKINKKVIIPLNGFRDMQYSWGRYEPTYYTVVRKLIDIEKIFNYLDGGLTEEINLNEQLKQAEDQGQTKNINCKYFTITFYKKGTCHIVFNNEDLLAKFNRFGSMKKGFLPPSYGKAKYEDMTTEEKSVIDEFEGKETYSKVIKNKNYYIYNPSNVLMLEQKAI